MSSHCVPRGKSTKVWSQGGGGGGGRAKGVSRGGGLRRVDCFRA